MEWEVYNAFGNEVLPRETETASLELMTSVIDSQGTLALFSFQREFLGGISC